MIKHSGLQHQTKLAQFHQAFEIDDEERKQLSARLIEEEAIEVFEELGDLSVATILFDKNDSFEVDRKKLAKELADLLYVCYGTALVYGID